MGKPAVSFRYKLIILCVAALLACGLTPVIGLAEEPVGAPVSVAVGSAPTASKGSSEAATPNSSIAADNEGSVLASTLAGPTSSILSADVALADNEAVIGSFTVDGLTYAVNSDGLALVSVDPATVPDGAVAIPESVIYNGTTYLVTSIAPYAFYLSGATQVELPATIASVESRAFRSSDVERVSVDASNPNYASFDGALYDASLTRLLLIPEGRKGSVLLSCETEVAESSVFSHCSLVDAIAVEEGGAAFFTSWNGLLYSADGTTLLRVPAGATEITIRDGCTTVAAGALEGCASLERINAPATITSISPDVFESVPTIALPAQSITQDESVAGGFDAERSAASPFRGTPPDADGFAEGEPADFSQAENETNPGVASALADQANVSTGFAPQLIATVALSSTENDLPEIYSAAIQIVLFKGADASIWQAAGFSYLASVASASSASVFAAYDAPRRDRINAYSDDDYTRRYSYEISSIPGGKYDYYLNENRNAEWKFLRLAPFDSKSDYIGVVSQRVWENKPAAPPMNVDCQSAGGAWWLRANSSMYETIGDTGATITWPDGTSEPMYYGEGEFYIPKNGMLVTLHQGVDVRIELYGADGKDEMLIQEISALSQSELPAVGVPKRAGYAFMGYFDGHDGAGTQYYDAGGKGLKQLLTREEKTARMLYAQWERMDFDLGFDTSAEPGDKDYPGESKPDETVSKEAGAVEIEDPKRPGYVFEGWVIPGADGTEAIDQELVYQDEDGKWYVDASKLPDYAGEDGRVELTARWTSVISVDVPQSVTFYADTVTQGQQSREGAASSAFGQNKVANQSEVDLRVVGLESSAVKTTDTALGADSILKKAEAATPSTSAGKLLSLYPSAKQWTAEELQSPDAVGGTKDASAVDFDLDDILLEKSFAADSFTIPAGDTLNMGYRLNLTETGQQLDYDKLATLEDGQSAAIANVSYCFAADALPSDWGEPLWVENPDRSLNPAKYLLLSDIKAAADDLSANSTSSKYYDLYKDLLDAQVMSNGNPGKGPYFQLKVDGVYLPLQLIGICQDTRSDNGKPAGLTFQMRDIYAYDNTRSAAAGGGAFESQMNAAHANSGGWDLSKLRNQLQTVFSNSLDAALREAIVPLDKYQQLGSGETSLLTGTTLQKTTNETVWLPSAHEVFGVSLENHNEAEGLTTIGGHSPFQYQAYQLGGTGKVNSVAVKKYDGAAAYWWLRTAYRVTATNFCIAYVNGSIGDDGAKYAAGVAPCFSL